MDPLLHPPPRDALDPRSPMPFAPSGYARTPIPRKDRERQAAEEQAYAAHAAPAEAAGAAGVVAEEPAAPTNLLSSFAEAKEAKESKAQPPAVQAPPRRAPLKAVNSSSSGVKAASKLRSGWKAEIKAP